MPRLLAPAVLFLAASCATTRTSTTSGTEVVARPGALTCARQHAGELGYTVRAGADTTTFTAERASTGDRLAVRMDPGTLRLRVDATGGAGGDEGTGARVTSDVRTIGQACGLLQTLPALPVPSS